MTLRRTRTFHLVVGGIFIYICTVVHYVMRVWVFLYLRKRDDASFLAQVELSRVEEIEHTVEIARLSIKSAKKNHIFRAFKLRNSILRYYT